MTLYDKWALVAVALCALGATECAALSEKRPRLTSSMRFFALSWTVLLPFYALQPYVRQQSALSTTPTLSPLTPLTLIAEFLPTYGGALLLLTAEPLLREARERGAIIISEKFLKAVDRVLERSIYFLVIPHSILFLAGGHEDQLVFMRLLDLILGAIGFVFIGAGFWMLTVGFWRHVFRRIFLPVSAVYVMAQTLWFVDIARDTKHAEVSPRFAVTFALCKVLTSAVFLALVMTIPKQQNADPDKSAAAVA